MSYTPDILLSNKNETEKMDFIRSVKPVVDKTRPYRLLVPYFFLRVVTLGSTRVATAGTSGIRH
jgi:hypothetical protein